MNAGAVDFCKACGRVIEYLGDCDCRNPMTRDLEVAMTNEQREEQELMQYQVQQGYEAQKELERYKKAVEMCVAAGFLDRKKFEEALKFLK